MKKINDIKNDRRMRIFSATASQYLALCAVVRSAENNHNDLVSLLCSCCEEIPAAAHRLPLTTEQQPVAHADVQRFLFVEDCVRDAYAMALAAERTPPAALLAMVGFIPHVAQHPLDLVTDGRPPVTIVHGSIDPDIDVSFGRAARDELVAAGLDVTYRETPVPHTIDAAWLPDLRHQIGMALRLD